MIQYWPPLTVSELGLLDAGSQTSSSSFWPIHNILARGAQVSSPKWRVKYQLRNTETLLALQPTRSQVVVLGFFFSPPHFFQQHEHHTLRSVRHCSSSKGRVMHVQRGARLCQQWPSDINAPRTGQKKLQCIMSERSRRLQPQQKCHPWRLWIMKLKIRNNKWSHYYRRCFFLSVYFKGISAFTICLPFAVSGLCFRSPFEVTPRVLNYSPFSTETLCHIMMVIILLYGAFVYLHWTKRRRHNAAPLCDFR